MNLAKPVKVKEGSSRASMCIVTTAFCGMIIIFSPSLMNSKMALWLEHFPVIQEDTGSIPGKGSPKFWKALQCSATESTNANPLGSSACTLQASVDWNLVVFLALYF